MDELFHGQSPRFEPHRLGIVTPDGPIVAIKALRGWHATVEEKVADGDEDEGCVRVADHGRQRLCKRRACRMRCVERGVSCRPASGHGQEGVSCRIVLWSMCVQRFVSNVRLAVWSLVAKGWMRLHGQLQTWEPNALTRTGTTQSTQIAGELSHAPWPVTGPFLPRPPTASFSPALVIVECGPDHCLVLPLSRSAQGQEGFIGPRTIAKKLERCTSLNLEALRSCSSHADMRPLFCGVELLAFTQPVNHHRPCIRGFYLSSMCHPRHQFVPVAGEAETAYFPRAAQE